LGVKITNDLVQFGLGFAGKRWVKQFLKSQLVEPVPVMQVGIQLVKVHSRLVMRLTSLSRFWSFLSHGEPSK
jgi:hypothetical protein